MTEDWPADPSERLTRLVHDLRTPLTIVAGFAELLERGGPALAEERREEYLRRVSQGAQDMKELLDEERADRLAQELREDRARREADDAAGD
jgi:signal transduction histidine kinase